jgi:hypothetical protein
MKRIIEGTKSTIEKLEEQIEWAKKELPDSKYGDGLIRGFEHSLKLLRLDLQLQEAIINKNFKL